jgi:hypothetical protein
LTGKPVQRLTADGSYAHPTNYAALEERSTDAIIPPMGAHKKCQKIPLRRFRYDGMHQIVTCPAGHRMKRSSRAKQGWVYRAKARDCGTCSLRRRCVPLSSKVRTVLIVDGYAALLRARRRRLRWDAEKYWYSRHRWRVEGVHGEAKTQHGLRRAIRRGLANVAIQVYLTAAVINLKRLAKFSFDRLHAFRAICDELSATQERFLKDFGCVTEPLRSASTWPCYY